MIALLNLFCGQMIDHRKQFSGHLPIKPFPIIDHRKDFDGHKSDHLPAKLFPMIDHLTVKLIQMSDHLTAKTMSMDELSPTVYICSQQIWKIKKNRDKKYNLNSVLI